MTGTESHANPFIKKNRGIAQDIFFIQVLLGVCLIDSVTWIFIMSSPLRHAYKSTALMDSSSFRT
jgi:hypothetical protein